MLESNQPDTCAAYVAVSAEMGLNAANDVASKNEFKVDLIFLHLQLFFN